MGKRRQVILSVLFMAVVLFTLAGISGSGISYLGGKASYAAASDTRTGVYKASYTANGKTTTEWCYLKNGKVQYNYTGFASNSSGWWYIEKGKVTFKKNDVIKGTVKGQSGWWFVKESKVQFVNSVEKNSAGWWCIQNGKVNFGYTGFAKNSSGWWYCEKGQVTFKKNDIIKGTVNGQSGWWFVKGSKVQFVDSVEKNFLGWWAVRNGKVDFNYTDFAKNSGGWWYCEKGQVTFKKNGIFKGTVNGQNGWWFVKGSKVQFVNTVEKNSAGWWCIQNGKVNFDYTGFAKNSGGYWYCERGKVRFNTNAIVQVNDGKYDGAWYVKNGKVQNNYSGELTTKDYKLTIKNGKVASVVKLDEKSDVEWKDVHFYYHQVGHDRQNTQKIYSDNWTGYTAYTKYGNGEYVLSWASKPIGNGEYEESNFDEKGNVTYKTIRDKNGSIISSDNSVHEYDSNGREIHERSYVYETSGERVGTNDTYYEYNDQGRLTKKRYVQMIGEEITRECVYEYAYDSYGNMIKETSKEDNYKKSSYTSYYYKNSYDNNGNLIKAVKYTSDTNEIVSVIESKYDKYGREIEGSSVYYENGKAKEKNVFKCNYDLFGNMVSYTNEGGEYNSSFGSIILVYTID